MMVARACHPGAAVVLSEMYASAFQGPSNGTPDALVLRRSFHYKTPLQVLCQTRLNTQPVYKVLEESGPAHEKAFVVSVSIAGVALGLGKRRTKKAAEQRAAEQALQKAQQATTKTLQG